MEVYTIGHTQTTAAEFFGKLKHAGIQRLVDVRLNNTSQLAGFAKRDDLEFFLRDLCGIEYCHEPRLAPTKEMLDAFKNHKNKNEVPGTRRLGWEEYVEQFTQLMADRDIETVLDRGLFRVPTVLLCSEYTADRCHRRLVLEYLDQRWGSIRVVHL